MREIRYFYKVVSDLRPECADFLVRTLQKIVEQPQLAHDLECRGVDRIAAEVAQEIGMLFEHRDIHAGTGQEKPQYHPGRAAAGDATPSL